MARGFGRGGYRGGGRRSFGGRSSVRRGSSRRSGGRPKGQIESGKSFSQYALKSKKGRTTYYGTSEDPIRRAAEHRATGKLGRGDKLEIQSRHKTRKAAERAEAAKLAFYRRRYGSNPKHNKTNDGKFH